MIKHITFLQPIILESTRDGVDIVFPFTLIDKEYIGTPEEENKYSKQHIKVGISGTLIACWGLDRYSDEDFASLVKLLFEFGKRHIMEKIQDSTLSEKEEIDLTTANAPVERPFNPKKTHNPEGAYYDIEMPDKNITQAIHESQFAAAIIDARDNINAIFKDRHKERLLLLTEERCLLELFRPASSQEEFSYRLASLAGLATNINISLLRQITGITDEYSKSLSLLEEFLRSIKNNGDVDSCIEILRKINRIRQSYPVHTDQANGVLDAHRFFDLSYPVKDFEDAWIKVQEKYKKALEIILEIVKEL
jgi:hypothetical protein